MLHRMFQLIRHVRICNKVKIKSFCQCYYPKRYVMTLRVVSMLVDIE